MAFKQDTLELPSIIGQYPRIAYDQNLVSKLNLPIYWVYNQIIDAWLPSTTPETNELPDRSALKRQRSREGFVIIPKLLTGGQCALAMEYFSKNDQYHSRPPDMDGVKRFATHNAPLAMYTHAALNKLVNYLLPEKVKPSYVFSSCYEKDGSLPNHIDSRPACTWNISLVVAGSEPDKLSTWPLHINVNGKISKVELNVGDAVLYSGIKHYHWREKLLQDWVYGMFFHFAPYNYKGSLD